MEITRQCLVPLCPEVMYTSLLAACFGRSDSAVLRPCFGLWSFSLDFPIALIVFAMFFSIVKFVQFSDASTNSALSVAFGSLRAGFPTFVVLTRLEPRTECRGLFFSPRPREGRHLSRLCTSTLAVIIAAGSMHEMHRRLSEMSRHRSGGF